MKRSLTFKGHEHESINYAEERVYVRGERYEFAQAEGAPESEGYL